MFIQNLSYARFHVVVSLENLSECKVVFNKGQAFFELEFPDLQSLHSFVLEIRKICICTDFNEKYKVIKLVEQGKKSKVKLIRKFLELKKTLRLVSQNPVPIKPTTLSKSLIREPYWILKTIIKK